MEDGKESQEVEERASWRGYQKMKVKQLTKQLKDGQEWRKIIQQKGGIMSSKTTIRTNSSSKCVGKHNGL